MLGDVFVCGWHGYHAYLLLPSFVVDNSDLFWSRPHHHAVSVNHLCYGAFIRHVVQFFYLRFEPSSSILKKTTLHSSNEAFETCWSALVINHGDTLQLLRVALDLNCLVIKLTRQTFDVNLHIVAGANDCLVVLHPNVSHLPRMRHIWLLKGHILLVEEEDFAGLRAYSNRTSIDCDC